MPEGHTIHRLAQDCWERFGGRTVRAASPQGKFSDGAALVDGQVLSGAEAHGKHLFLGFQTAQESDAFHEPLGPGWVHVHLGLYGKFTFGTGSAPAPVGQVRLRLADGPDGRHYADLRGPARCELITGDGKLAVEARLGPDPLRRDADPGRAWSRVSRSRTTIAALLMDQTTVAGVGNVYRAEVLFRHGINPYRMGRDLSRSEWDAIWADLAELMREGVRHNRIDTVRPQHTPEAMGRAPVSMTTAARCTSTGARAGPATSAAPESAPPPWRPATSSGAPTARPPDGRAPDGHPEGRPLPDGRVRNFTYRPAPPMQEQHARASVLMRRPQQRFRKRATGFPLLSGQLHVRLHALLSLHVAPGIDAPLNGWIRSIDMAVRRQSLAPQKARSPRAHKALHRVRTRLRRSAVDYFRGGVSDWLALGALLLTVPALTFLTVLMPVWCAPEALVLPIIAGGLLLRPASLLGLYATAAVALIVESAMLGSYQDSAGGVTPGTILVVAAAGLSGLLVAQFRSRVGVPWRRGGTMLFDLRERIRVQSKLPKLPGGWHREMALRPAGGQSFSGDFVVAARTGTDERTLEVVLTDVSGKGMDAGSRALLLSGAFGGLLGSLPPHAFLPAANGYLLRQDWDEGFATSVHLVLDLESGDYELFSAGHVPALQRGAGTGKWEEKSGDGPLLGVYDGAQFDPVKGTLLHGDVLMLFTDGLVETAERDLSDGLDRLTGEADRYVASGFQGAAWHLIETVARDVNDDRALLLLCRA